MSRFLGGSSTTNKTHAIELVNELDHDLSRASANVRPFKTQIESFDVVLNAHIPEEAGRTIAKLLEVGQPDIVFLENCKITDGHEVAERLDFSLRVASRKEPVKAFDPSALGYSGLITTSLASRGSIVFPVDARWSLFKEIEAAAGEEIAEEFLSHDRRYTPSALGRKDAKELINLEVDRLIKHSFMLETRDKVAVLQMLSFVTGLLNRDSELLVQLGLKESQTAQLIDDIGKKTKHRDGRVTLGSVYGYNHLGLPPLIKNHFPNSKSHPLATKAVALNRRSYGGLYISEPNFKNDIGLLEEIAARSIVEDIFFIPTHYPEIFGTLTCVTDPMRKIAKVAKDVCDASNGAKKLIETLTPEQAALVLQEKGIVLRL